ncbi:hypothetical protein ABNJ07_002861 [Vibrio parahaemolyticus]
MKIIDEIKKDLVKNESSGLLCKCIFVTYRIGKNTKYKSIRKFVSVFHSFFSMLSNCSIPYACDIGNEVLFKHGFYGVYLSSSTVIGDNCTILHNVTIGSKYLDKNSSPTIGRNVIIGTGAVIVGDIEIGCYSKISPNSFVMENIDSHTTVISKCIKVRK